MFWIKTVCLMTLLCLFVYTQPMFCKEDVHCSEGYYCAIQAHVCHPCLQCQDFNRFTPNLLNETQDSCIKTLDTCGPCFDGFININENLMKGQCLSPELLQFESNTYCIYVWVTAAIIGSLVVVMFLYVIRNTLVLQIEPQYDPVATIVQTDEKTMELSESVILPPNNLAKRVLLAFKNWRNPEQ